MGRARRVPPRACSDRGDCGPRSRVTQRTFIDVHVEQQHVLDHIRVIPSVFLVRLLLVGYEPVIVVDVVDVPVSLPRARHPPTTQLDTEPFGAGLARHDVGSFVRSFVRHARLGLTGTNCTHLRGTLRTHRHRLCLLFQPLPRVPQLPRQSPGRQPFLRLCNQTRTLRSRRDLPVSVRLTTHLPVCGNRPNCSLPQPTGSGSHRPARVHPPERPMTNAAPMWVLSGRTTDAAVRTCVTRGNSIKCPRDAEQNCPSAPKRGGRRRLGCWSLTVSFPCSPGYVEMQVRRTRRRILVWADAQLGVSRAPSGRGRGHGALLLGQGIHRWGLRGPRRCQRGSSGGIRRRRARSACRMAGLKGGAGYGRCQSVKCSI